LCGSCDDVCPVKINIHHQLLTWRREIAVRGYLPWTKRFSMRMMSMVLRRPWLYRMAGSLGRFALRWSPRFMVYNGLNAWGKQRELPAAPKQSFRAQFKQRQATNGKS
jgi:L-lactate dehydrogenase complex protein LldF